MAVIKRVIMLCSVIELTSLDPEDKLNFLLHAVQVLIPALFWRTVKVHRAQ